MTEARQSSALSFVGLFAVVAIAAASVAPHDQYFLGNFALYWIPLAGVLAVLVLAGSGVAVAAGADVVLAVYLVGYHSWALSLATREWVWGSYLLALPGAVVGGLTASYLRRRYVLGFVAASFVAVAGTAAGLALNMGLLCSTLMYCRG